MIHTLRGRKFDYLKICKNVLIEIKENAFSMNHFGQKKIFFINGWYFLEIFGWNLREGAKALDNVAQFS